MLFMTIFAINIRNFNYQKKRGKRKWHLIKKFKRKYVIYLQLNKKFYTINKKLI